MDWSGEPCQEKRCAGRLVRGASSLRLIHHGRRMALALLKAIENELDAAGDSEFFENAEEVIAHDLLLARGWSALRVALTTYGLTAGLVVVANIAMRMAFSRALVASALISGGLVAAAVRLGALHAESRPQTESAPVKLRRPRHWLPERRVRQKI